MIESETVEVGFDAVLLVLKSGVDVVSAVPAVVFCISAVDVIPTEEALAVFVTAVSDSVVSETLSSSSSFSSSQLVAYTACDYLIITDCVGHKHK